MAKTADRAKETSTTTGTGNFTLAGAVTQFQSLNAGIGTGALFMYAIVGQSGSEWEVGEGFLSDSTTLVRSVVRSSSNSNALVNFSAGTKDVFATVTAERIQSQGPWRVTAMGWALP